MSKWNAIVVGAMAGLALATGPAMAQDPGVTDTSVKIGIFAPLSGPAMAYGFDVVNAAKMYYDKVNADGHQRPQDRIHRRRHALQRQRPRRGGEEAR
jgi:hypothetical protein